MGRLVCCESRLVSVEEGILVHADTRGQGSLWTNTALWPRLHLDEKLEWPIPINWLVMPSPRLQPNLATRQKQLDAWCVLVLAYHRHHKLYNLDVVESQSSPLFHNKPINRKLSPEGINSVLEELRKRGHIEWTDKTRKHCLLVWRTPAEWGKLIYEWANSNGMTNTVCTYYELTHGDDTASQEFHGLDPQILTKALKTLELQKKAEIMSIDGNDGVKFF